MEVSFDDTTNLSLNIVAPGRLETVQWRSQDNAQHEPELTDFEVEVGIQAIGLISRDLHTIKSRRNENVLGHQCAGIVKAAGKLANFAPGDQVCFVGLSLLRSPVRVDSRMIYKLPTEISIEEGAIRPWIFWRAHHTLVELGKLSETETVLLLNPSTIEDFMLIPVVKAIGSRLLIVAPEDDHEMLVDDFKVTRDDIWNLGGSDLQRRIMEATDGDGVDLLVFFNAQELDRVDLLDYLAFTGRIIEGHAEDEGRQNADKSPHTRSSNRGRSSLTQAHVADLLSLDPSPKVFASFQAALTFGFHHNLQLPFDRTTFKASDVQKAFTYMADHRLQHIIIDMSPGSRVSALVGTRPEYMFDSNATYVIAGGFGGLGRSFARWMSSRGAQHLIILSRSGPASEAAMELLNEMTEKGVCIKAPPVDISDLEKLASTLDACLTTMPPIQGCIQATVSLRDNLFENMTYEDWKISTDSKVVGSWNLHQAMPKDLDFFVILASINGIFGGRAQANYAAGNTFKDALARHRTSIGQKAISIDLGLMVTEGIVSENEHLLSSMQRLGHLMEIEQEELIALLDYYCDPRLPVLCPEEAQVLVGIEIPANVLAKGIDLHHSTQRPLFRHLFQMQRLTQSSEESEHIDRPSQMRLATSLDAASNLVLEWFSSKLAQILGLQMEAVNIEEPVHTHGIDSLVAIDLRNWFLKEVGATIETFTLLGNDTIEEICHVAAQSSKFRLEM